MKKFDDGIMVRFANPNVPTEKIVNTIIANLIKADGNITTRVFDMHGGKVTKDNRRRETTAISMFWDEATLRNVVKAVIKANVVKLAEFLEDAGNTDIILTARFKKDIGIAFTTKDDIGTETNRVKVTIAKDEYDPFRLFTKTAFPIV